MKRKTIIFTLEPRTMKKFQIECKYNNRKKASNERLSENGKTANNNIKQWESSKTLQQITKDNSSAHILWFFCYFYYSIACCCHFYWFFSRHKSLLLLLLLLAILYFILYFLYLIVVCTLCWIVQCSRFAQFDKGARATRIDRIRAYQVWALFVFTMIVHVWIRFEKISRSLVYFIVIAYAFATRCL